jgi:hypothetical protein
MYIENSGKAVDKKLAHKGERDKMEVDVKSDSIIIKPNIGKTKIKITTTFMDGSKQVISEEIAGSSSSQNVSGAQSVFAGNAFADDYSECYSGYMLDITNYEDECEPVLIEEVDGIQYWKTTCFEKFMEFKTYEYRYIIYLDGETISALKAPDDGLYGDTPYGSMFKIFTDYALREFEEYFGLDKVILTISDPASEDSNGVVDIRVNAENIKKTLLGSNTTQLHFLLGEKINVTYYSDSWNYSNPELITRTGYNLGVARIYIDHPSYNSTYIEHAMNFLNCELFFSGKIQFVFSYSINGDKIFWVDRDYDHWLTGFDGDIVVNVCRENTKEWNSKELLSLDFLKKVLPYIAESNKAKYINFNRENTSFKESTVHQIYPNYKVLYNNIKYLADILNANLIPTKFYQYNGQSFSTSDEEIIYCSFYNDYEAISMLRNCGINIVGFHEEYINGSEYSYNGNRFKAFYRPFENKKKFFPIPKEKIPDKRIWTDWDYKVLSSNDLVFEYSYITRKIFIYSYDPLSRTDRDVIALENLIKFANPSEIIINNVRVISKQQISLFKNYPLDTILDRYANRNTKITFYSLIEENKIRSSPTLSQYWNYAKELDYFVKYKNKISLEWEDGDIVISYTSPKFNGDGTIIDFYEDNINYNSLGNFFEAFPPSNNNRIIFRVGGGHVIHYDTDIKKYFYHCFEFDEEKDEIKIREDNLLLQVPFLMNYVNEKIVPLLNTFYRKLDNVYVRVNTVISFFNELERRYYNIENGIQQYKVEMSREQKRAIVTYYALYLMLGQRDENVYGGYYYNTFGIIVKAWINVGYSTDYVIGRGDETDDGFIVDKSDTTITLSEDENIIEPYNVINSNSAYTPIPDYSDKVTITTSLSGKEMRIVYSSDIEILSIAINGYRIDKDKRLREDGSAERFDCGGLIVQWNVDDSIVVKNYNGYMDLEIGNAYFKINEV